jgi:hypothetical protein
LIVVAPLLPLFPPPLPAPLLLLLFADTITTFATTKTTAQIPSATAAAAATAAAFLPPSPLPISDFTDYRQRIRRTDTPFVSAAAAPLPLSMTPLPPPFPPRQPPLPKMSNLQVGRRQQRIVGADTMVKSVGSGRSTLDNISLF